MIARKFLLLILAGLTLKGGFSQNATQNVTKASKILVVSTEAPPNNSSIFGGLNATQPTYRVNGTLPRNSSHGEPPPDGNNVKKVVGTTVAPLNGSSIPVEETLNQTLDTNFSTVAAAVAQPEAGPAFRLQKSAAIAAGVFLVSAVIGYLSCVGYRRYLQRKYGESQILAKEDVYDTSDLQYIAI